VIIVNGKETAWRPGLTVQQLLKDLGNNFPIVVVKIDGKPVPKKEFDTFEIPDDVEVSTVDIIAGG
jgi:thiamine biosynthesis protein ThiS